MNISEERFKEIMDSDNPVDWEGDNALIGLNIIAKYLSHQQDIICGADHDIIYSVDVDKLIEAGIIELDVKKLRNLNWTIHNDYLACYV